MHVFVGGLVANSGLVASHVTQDVYDGGWRYAIVLYLFLIVVACGVGTAGAQSYYELDRGTATRSALMDAIRPHIEWDLGQPIEFVVNDLRVLGDVAFKSLAP